jgi:hypothetical protein
MTFRTRVALLCSFAVVLLGAFVLGQVLSPLRTGAVSAEALLLPGFNAEAVHTIRIEDSSQAVLLTRSGDWTVDVGGAPYPASSSKLAFLLQELSRLTRGKLVTRAPEKAAQLGIGVSQTVRLTATSEKGETLCELFVGKTGATGRGRYVRAGDGPEIYDTAGSLSPYTSTEKRFWENLRIFPEDIKTDDIVRVEIKSKLSLSGGKDAKTPDYTLSSGLDQNGAKTWSISGKNAAEASPSKIRNIIDAVLSMEGNDFEASAGAVRRITGGPQATVELSTSDGRLFTLCIAGSVEGNQYPCAPAGGKYAYLVPEWRVQQALVTPESLSPQAR